MEYISCQLQLYNQRDLALSKIYYVTCYYVLLIINPFIVCFICFVHCVQCMCCGKHLDRITRFMHVYG